MGNFPIVNVIIVTLEYGYGLMMTPKHFCFQKLDMKLPDMHI